MSEKDTVRELIKEFELDTGEKVKVYKPIVKDLVDAQKMVKNPEELTVAMLSRIVEINGQKKPYEEWLYMDLSVFMEAMEVILPFLGRFQQISQKQS